MRVQESLGITGDATKETTKLQVMGVLAKKVGKLIHDFSVAGLYRHGTTWSNLQYDFERKIIFLTDLDSTRHLDELPPKVQSLQILRDLASALYWFLGKFYYAFEDQYTLSNLLRYDPLSEIISGYFPNVPRKNVEEISRVLWSFFTPHLFLLKRYKKTISNDFSTEHPKIYEMDYPLFFILAIITCYPLYQKSELNIKYPSYFTSEQLLNNAKAYLGEQYEYLLYLMENKNFIAFK